MAMSAEERNARKREARRRRDAATGRIADLESFRKWCAANPERYKVLMQEYRRRNRKKEAARSVFRRAVMSGRVVRAEKCQECGGSPVEGHHEDYDKPLDVAWLCKVCHGKRHRKKEAA